MIKGLYSAASAMHVNRKNMNIISNNLANVDTDGYKKDATVQRTFSKMLISRISNDNKEKIGELGTQVEIDDIYTDFTAGKIKHTGNSLDLAIKGSGYFALQTPQGIRYTRNGNFTLNEQSQIVNNQGYLLLDKNGDPIQSVQGRSISIDENGQIYFGDLMADKIGIFDVENSNNLKKNGDNLYQTTDNNVFINENAKVVQGYLEGSNVNIVKEMANMIESTRAYETNQKVIRTIDNSLDKTVNDVGRLA